MLEPCRLLLLWLAFPLVVAGVSEPLLVAQETEAVLGSPTSVPDGARLMESWGNESVQVYLDHQTLWLVPTKKALADNRLTIARLCAPIRSMQWAESTDDPPKFVPEPDYWVFSWRKSPAGNLVIKVVFDRKPVLPADCEPATPAGDGSVMLHAFAGATFGEKLRYEPQWYKNTVGYWTKPGDSATWKLKVDKPGQYSVAVLQGCGKGQGGSDATISLLDGDGAVATLPFKTIDTGHFQNFRWNHLGLIDVPKAGSFQLKIQPNRIAKGALFDARAIHLVPQAKPEAR